MPTDLASPAISEKEILRKLSKYFYHFFIEKFADEQLSPGGTVAGMNLVEWLRTPRYLKSRLMMETRPFSRVEMEVVFLEVSGGCQAFAADGTE